MLRVRRSLVFVILIIFAKTYAHRATRASHLADQIANLMYDDDVDPLSHHQIEDNNKFPTTFPSLIQTNTKAPTKLPKAAFQKVMNAGGGSVEPGTEGFDPNSATSEPNDKCRTEANKYRTQCLFGSAFNNDTPE